MVKMGIIKECGVSQQFQRGAYIQVQRFRCGKKGFGLKVIENVCKDSFIIEYIGEVLNIPAYEARQKEYAVKGQKHFYFMSLSSTEVVFFMFLLWSNCI
jgi:hypothetical protein